MASNYEKYGRAIHDANRIWLFEQKSKPCADCHKQYHPRLMEFDHLKDKKFSIGSHAHHSRRKLELEVAKCEVVCVLCHSVRTWNRAHPDDPITNLPLNDILE